MTKNDNFGNGSEKNDSRPKAMMNLLYFYLPAHGLWLVVFLGWLVGQRFGNGTLRHSHESGVQSHFDSLVYLGFF